MTRAAAVLGSVFLLSCGNEVTNLIPKLACFDSRAYPGGGLREADVAQSSGLTLNGRAAVAGDSLRIADASRNAVGTAFFSQTVSLEPTSNLAAYFTVRIGGGSLLNGADGLAFILQSSPAGATAVGLDGGGIGYQRIAPSLALEFDPYHDDPDPVGGHIAAMRDGDINFGLLGYVNPAFALNDGVARHVWIDYDAAAQTLWLYMSDQAARPDTPLLTQTGIPLNNWLGSTVFAGFTASSGELFNDHDVLGEAWVAASPLPFCD